MSQCLHKDVGWRTVGSPKPISSHSPQRIGAIGQVPHEGAVRDRLLSMKVLAPLTLEVMSIRGELADKRLVV